jgi:hypothetical protein
MATEAPRLPRKLYKYKSFDVNTLRMLSEAEVYFANRRSSTTRSTVVQPSVSTSNGLRLSDCGSICG